MTEPKDDPLEALAAKAAARAGKDAAERAVAGLRGEENEGRRWRLVVYAVLGLCLVLGVVGFVLSYWMYFLGAGVLGALAVLGYWRLKARLAASREPEAAAAPAKAPERVRVEPEVAAPAPEPQVDARARAQALAEARAADAQAVEDELAAMKARLRR